MKAVEALCLPEADERMHRADSTEEDANDRRYQCRFCFKIFDKSQSLGGHMNRHRQERDQEQLRQAHVLVMQNNIQQGGGYTCLFQNGGIPISKFSPRIPPSLPSQFSGTQSHQQSSIYNQSHLSLNQGGSSIAYAQVSDIASFAAKQEDFSSGRSTAYATPLNDMGYLSQGRNHDFLGMSYERPTESPSNFFSSETNTQGVLPVQRGDFLQRQGSTNTPVVLPVQRSEFLQRQGSGVVAGLRSSSSDPGFTERRFNPSLHQSSSYTNLGTDYNLYNTAGDGASQHFNLQSGSSIQGISLITTPNSAGIPIPPPTDVDLAGKIAMGSSSRDFENPWIYSQHKVTTALSSIPTEEFDLSLSSDTMDTGPPPNSQGTGRGLPDEYSARQRVNMGADSSSLSFGIDYNAEIESKYNQGIPKDY